MISSTISEYSLFLYLFCHYDLLVFKSFLSHLFLSYFVVSCTVRVCVSFYTLYMKRAKHSGPLTQRGALILLILPVSVFMFPFFFFFIPLNKYSYV